MEEQLSLFSAKQFDEKKVNDRRALNNKNYPASGWIEEYYKQHGKTVSEPTNLYSGPYYQFRCRIDNKLITKYVSKTKVSVVAMMIVNNRPAKEILAWLSKRPSSKTNR